MELNWAIIGCENCRGTFCVNEMRLGYACPYCAVMIVMQSLSGLVNDVLASETELIVKRFLNTIDGITHAE